MSDTLKALMLGDVFGQPGFRAVFIGLKQLKKKYQADFVVINGENAAGGFGITPELADQIFTSGADVITSGNHIWQKREILPYLDDNDRILRPANYPPGVPGKGQTSVDVKGTPVTVINLQGRQQMMDTDCPFRKATDILKRDKSKIVLVDFHAETVEEKEAMAYHLDGKVSAVVGTHTHIQTADERIFPNGTAYITDLGMIGPEDSVIGGDTETSIQRALTQMPLKMLPSENKAIICGVVLEIDKKTGKTVSIERIREHASF